jgi:hypothetical protein
MDFAIIQEYILKSFPPFIAILILFLAWLIKNNKDKVFSFIMSRSFNPKENLLNHDLFSLINRVKNIAIYEIEFEYDEVKTFVFRDFVKIKINSIDKFTKEFIEKGKFDKLTKAEFDKKVSDLITDIISSYNKGAHSHFISHGMTKEQADHVINIFNKWHSDTVKAVYSRTDSVISSAYYRSNYMKVVAILEIFAIAVELTISDGVKSFNELNGYFKKIDYKKL